MSEEKILNKQAIEQFDPMTGSAAVGILIECAECGLLTIPARADFVEGDGGMTPDRWFCRACWDSDTVPDADYE
jgi:predicted lipoprotein